MSSITAEHNVLHKRKHHNSKMLCQRSKNTWLAWECKSDDCLPCKQHNLTGNQKYASPHSLLSCACLISISLFFPSPNTAPSLPPLSCCNLSLQMSPTPLRISNACQSERTLLRSHGTRLCSTVEFPLKVPPPHPTILLSTASDVQHLMSLNPRRIRSLWNPHCLFVTSPRF